MPVSLITVTHNNIGKEIYQTSCMIFGSYFNNYEHIGLCSEFDLDALSIELDTLITKFEKGDGVLILTDIYGASPCNLACRFSSRTNVAIISGLNLAMMLKVANKSYLPLKQLTKEIIAVGRKSIDEH